MTYLALHIKTNSLPSDSLLNLSLSTDLCGSGMQPDASISRGALLNWGLSLFPSPESTQPNSSSYIYKHERMEEIQTLRDVRGFLPYLISTWLRFALYIPSTLTPAHIVHAWLASLSSSGWVFANGASYKVWRSCDGLIYHSRTSLTLHSRVSVGNI